MRYIYGPVQSRRLGLSLGLSLTEYKTCSFDCVYCQLGRTTVKTCEHSSTVSPGKVIAELKDWLKGRPEEAEKLDYISIAGSGEPTLNPGIEEVIKKIKKLTAVKVAVLTNASLMVEPGVRAALRGADLVVPSIDAVTQDLFDAIDRPVAGLKVARIIQALILFRKEFKHALWLEVMVLKGMNDTLAHARKLKAVAARIKPDRIQLNSPVRSTTEPDIKPAARSRLEQIKKILGPRCEII